MGIISSIASGSINGGSSKRTIRQSLTNLGTDEDSSKMSLRQSLNNIMVELAKSGCCGSESAAKYIAPQPQQQAEPIIASQPQPQAEPIQLVSVIPDILGEDNPKADITQDAINEMAATADPELLNSLSAEKLMSSFQKNPYAQVETEYTDVEMDIVRYIMQDMIGAARAVNGM